MRDITQYIVVGEWWPAYVLRLVKGRDKKKSIEKWIASAGHVGLDWRVKGLANKTMGGSAPLYM